MLKWSKIINEETKEVQLGVGQDADFYQSIGMEELDVEQSYLGLWYISGYAPKKPEPTHDDIIKQQINELEQKITPRNTRGAILQDEYALNKLTEVEEQIKELRKQLDE